MEIQFDGLKWGISALISGLGALPQSAKAVHTSAVLTTELDGSTEVASASDVSQTVGDRTGTGQAYIFGVDGDEAAALISPTGF